MHFFPQIPPHPYAINLDPILFCTLMGPMRKFTGCCRIFYSNVLKKFITGTEIVIKKLLRQTGCTVVTELIIFMEQKL